MIGIPLVDHIIVGGDNSQYLSFKEKDKLPASNLRYGLKTDYREIEFTGQLAAEKGKMKL
jgi:DNA repair protein RadC